MFESLSAKDHPGLISIRTPFLPSCPAGGGGVSYVAFIPRGEQTAIWGCCLNESAPELQEVVEWPAEWRKIAEFLSREDAYVSCADLVECKPEIVGLDGYEADVVALSSMHDGDPPMNHVARGLVSLSDNQLSSLHSQYHSFLDDDFVRNVYTMIIEIDEIGMDMYDLPAAFLRANTAGPCDLQKVFTCLPEWKADYAKGIVSEEERLTAEANERAGILAPHRKQIDALVLIAIGDPPRRQWPGLAYKARRRNVLEYVENYVLAHKSLPFGVHDFKEVGFMSSGKIKIGQVDFGRLRTESEWQAILHKSSHKNSD